VSSAPEDPAAAAEQAFERLLRHERAITVAGLVALVALAWAWLFAGAGMAMQEPMAAMPGMSGMPGMSDAPGLWSPTTWALMLAMWWTMMVAMMTPSATPTILLYARVHRHAAAQGSGIGSVAPTGAFAAGYLLLWLVFSLLATALQFGLQRAELLSADSLGSRSHWLSAGVLLFAGAYQLSPFKSACLSHCRAPAAFLSRHWRPGAGGALRLGVLHGAYCIGCCWLLMALLFVVGVMKLAWIAALDRAGARGKSCCRAGVWIGRAVGLVLLAWAAFVLTSY
jgi:predicted metal-binding membrane protein